ncbi:MarR family winged helix-turn-helix transcriptional regulator [Streptomyces sp. NBC_00212]|uniref:MarR family winged helix-turn-helix transcriptional regulator n=1 Tax=Streptomyces sp. NBC_00212 TaxID=2975684 RepID=UPI0038641EB0
MAHDLAHDLAHDEAAARKSQNPSRRAVGEAGLDERAPDPQAPDPQPRGRSAPDQETLDQNTLDQEAEEVAVAVMAASRLLVAISARALSSIDDSMTLPQLRALVVLESCEPLKLAAMAATLGVNPSTAMRMVDRLEAVGLVDRRTNPASRREVVLNLTDAGRDLVGRVMAHRQAEVSALVARLPADERAGLVPALRALTRAAGELAVDPFDEVRRIGGLVADPLAPGR